MACIGLTQTHSNLIQYIYVKHSSDISRRLQEHKSQDLDIYEFSVSSKQCVEGNTSTVYA